MWTQYATRSVTHVIPFPECAYLEEEERLQHTVFVGLHHARCRLRLAEREAVADQRPRVHLAPFRLGTASTTITSPAPKSRAPTVAIGPTGPWAETATVPPPGMLAYSLP